MFSPGCASHRQWLMDSTLLLVLQHSKRYPVLGNRHSPCAQNHGDAGDRWPHKVFELAALSRGKSEEPVSITPELSGSGAVFRNSQELMRAVPAAGKAG
jgi:hypothetical protein